MVTPRFHSLQWLLIAVSLLIAGSALAADADLPDDGRLSLSQALAIARERNPQISLAAIAVRAADAATLSANVSPNPSLSVSAFSINPHQGIGAGGPRDKMIDTSVRVEQLIERGGKRALRTENASRLADASRADLAEARRQLDAAVSNAYFGLLGAQEKLDITRDTAGLFEATLGAAERRRQAGDLAGAEVERLRVDALRARNDTRQAESELQRARLALMLVMGLPARADKLTAVSEWPAPSPMPAPADLERLLERHPDVRAAQARVQAAQSALKLAQAQRTRDVSVGVQYDRSPASPANSFYTANSYGVSVQIPLFVNNYFEGDIRNAAAGLDSAQENLQRARFQAGADLQRAWTDMQSAGDRLLRLREELGVAARRAVDAAEFAFRNGAISVTDVLDARRTFRAITLDELSARADYAKALAAWRAATLENSHP